MRKPPQAGTGSPAPVGVDLAPRIAAETHGSFLVPPRHTGPELIDVTEPTRAEWERALAEIALVNRWLGGYRPVRREILRLARREGLREISILDVGTGGADVPTSLKRSLERTGLRVRAAGCDLNAEAASVAKRNGGAEVFRADAFRLPFPDGAFDAVIAGLFLHHFEEAPGARMLAELHRVARRLVIVNDLARHRVAWLLIRVLAQAGRASPLFRHDAPLSVLRGFTPAELSRLAQAARLGVPRIERRWAFRLLLVAEKAGP